MTKKQLLELRLSNLKLRRSALDEEIRLLEQLIAQEKPRVIRPG